MIGINKQTYFKAGGLLVPLCMATGKRRVEAAGVTVPPSVDRRVECTARDDQGQVPACCIAAFTNVVEQRRWRATGKAVQLPFLDIYDDIKLEDHDKSDGLTLERGYRGLQDRGFIRPDAEPIYISSFAEYQRACHRYDGCVLGFQITDNWNRVNRITGFIPDGGSGIGGHAVPGSGYDAKSGFGPNHWTLSWGWRGYWRLTPAEFDRELMYGITWE